MCCLPVSLTGRKRSDCLIRKFILNLLKGGEGVCWGPLHGAFTKSPLSFCGTSWLKTSQLETLRSFFKVRILQCPFPFFLFLKPPQQTRSSLFFSISTWPELKTLHVCISDQSLPPPSPSRQALERLVRPQPGKKRTFPWPLTLQQPVVAVFSLPSSPSPSSLSARLCVKFAAHCR